MVVLYSDTLLNEPTECFMGNPSCFSMVGLWGVGTTGQCHLDAYGFPMGEHGYKYAVIEVTCLNLANRRRCENLLNCLIEILTTNLLHAHLVVVILIFSS